MTPEKTVARLSLYRRFLKIAKEDGVDNVYSHQLAEMVRSTPAQVRRDLMILGYNGSPQKGYDVAELIKHIDTFFNTEKIIDVILVGVGNIGRALLSYFRDGKSHIKIIASFDKDETKAGRVINNSRCYAMDDLKNIVAENNVKTAILSVPATDAQSIADILVENGIRGILNFAPTRLKVPSDVFVEDVDITMNMEKVIYFSAGKKK
ncbi:MAG TPA: redox-sensing transcriptional repressor Rex [bacterium]|nr:redox-sensing transcriptional repressor Rex [bacterium]